MTSDISILGETNTSSATKWLIRLATYVEVTFRCCCGGLAKFASVFGHRLDREDRAEELCSVIANLIRAAFHYALHYVMFWVRSVHLVHKADGQGVPCYNFLHGRLVKEVLPN